LTECDVLNAHTYAKSLMRVYTRIIAITSWSWTRIASYRRLAAQPTARTDDGS